MYSLAYQENYTLSAQPASVTADITKRPITITAKDQTVDLGGSIATSTDEVEITGSLADTFFFFFFQSLNSIYLKLSDESCINVAGEHNNAIIPGGAVITDGSGNTVDLAGNYDIAYKNGKLTVNKIQAKVNTPPEAITGLKYTGENQQLITAGAADTAMEYAFGENDSTAPITGWSNSVPGGTGAKTYYVWYRAAEDANHTASDAKVVTVTISSDLPLTGFCGNPSVNDGKNLCWTLAWDADQGIKILTISNGYVRRAPAIPGGPIKAERWTILSWT